MGSTLSSKERHFSNPLYERLCLTPLLLRFSYEKGFEIHINIDLFERKNSFLRTNQCCLKTRVEQRVRFLTKYLFTESDINFFVKSPHKNV